jgi:hypothetical protein
MYHSFYILAIENLLIIENNSQLEPNSLHLIKRALHMLLLRADGVSLLLRLREVGSLSNRHAIFVKDKWDWGKYYCDSSDERTCAANTERIEHILCK